MNVAVLPHKHDPNRTSQLHLQAHTFEDERILAALNHAFYGGGYLTITSIINDQTTTVALIGSEDEE